MYLRSRNHDDTPTKERPCVDCQGPRDRRDSALRWASTCVACNRERQRRAKEARRIDTKT